MLLGNIVGTKIFVWTMLSGVAIFDIYVLYLLIRFIGG